MPRLSLYRPEKTQDYKFIDRSIYEMFQVGGVDVHMYKYIGPQDPSDPSKALGETTIQDVIFLENRDRKYDQDIYTLRGVFNVQDVDFNLSQFGLFLQNDTVFLTIHINNSVDLIGRKVMTGDVVELPNLKDEYALNDFSSALKRFYVVEDINRAAEGFSSTWYPHLYRLKLKPLVDSQEFKDILDRPEDTDSYAGDFVDTKLYYPGQIVKYYGELYIVNNVESTANGTSNLPTDTVDWSPYVDNSIRNVISSYDREMQLNDSILLEAEADAPKSGYETNHFYTLAIDPETGKPVLNTVDTINDTVSQNFNIDGVNGTPVRSGYSGYLIGDGIPENQNIGQFGFGLQFPPAPFTGDSFLRTDFLPNRLFRWDGARWVKQEDNVRMSLTNSDTRQTLKTSFINNREVSGITKLASAVIVIDSLNLRPIDPDGVTDSIEVLTDYVNIITTIDYSAEYKVEAWINEDGRATVTTYEVNGKLAAKLNDSIRDGSRVRYTIYDNVVPQRQSLSKALKIKPRADL
jgi:hypothetical protein